MFVEMKPCLLNRLPASMKELDSIAHLRGRVSKKSTFFLKNWHPVRGPMSFTVKGKKKGPKSRQRNTSHCPTKTISINDTRPHKWDIELRGKCRKNQHFLKNWHPVCGPTSFAAKEKKKEKRNDQNQDKQTPHTVLQKLSPKTTHVPLNLNWRYSCLKEHLI